MNYERILANYMASDRKGSLDLRGCTGLTALPDGLTVGGGLYFNGCTGLTALPDGLTVGGSLNLSGCTGLTALPDGLTVGGSLDLSNCTGLTTLPDGLTVGDWLGLSGCTGLTALPDGLTVGGSLYLNGCTGLTTLPDGLTVGGDLDLNGCTGLTALPDGLTVGGGLGLRGCTGLTALPDGLAVGGGLYLGGCTSLTALPDGLTVDGGLPIPVVPRIDAAILQAINAGGSLQMDTWHSCRTTHCRAGWAVTLAGDGGAALENAIGSANAGALIYLASRPGKPFPDFYADNATALADLQACAAEQTPWSSLTTTCTMSVESDRRMRKRLRPPGKPAVMGRYPLPRLTPALERPRPFTASAVLILPNGRAGTLADFQAAVR